MARVVCVHGMGQQLQGEDRLRSVWWPALSDGLRRAGAEGLATEADVEVGFYGDLFRPAGQFLAAGDPPYTARDVEDGFERELLAAWWQAAAETDPEVASPDATDALAATPRSVQAALRALSGSKFFANLALRAVVSDLKQVRAYLTDQKTRERARGRVMDRIGPDTRVVIAHSLGSVVAYEALCALPGHGVRALVTIGSPLGMRNLVVDRLQPAPAREGKAVRGAWPGGDKLTWTNLAGAGDVVALVKDLRPVFGDRLRSAVLSNGTHAHDATSYLTDALCGRAIAEGLA
ncbi:alpha/beta hydrolase [Streptomyces sp. NRRL S-237]|uniref:alpha/beta hydrolase n=1 Tax=Streptomyces sp. NRRL S-237 TaxID=1463895 RepID=UPI0004CAAB28|nr:alpha/beta hydrolase [Streptomyces sp. NRRL S-237]